MSGQGQSRLEIEWEAFMNAPLLTVSVIIVVGGVIWFFVNLIYSTRNENQKSTIARYKDMLDVTSPDEAKEKIEALEQQLAKLAPRRLTVEQKVELKKAVSANPGSINLQYVSGVSDGARYQRDFAEAFQDTGWELSGGMLVSSILCDTGLVVNVYRDGPSAQTVLAALRTVGIQYDLAEELALKKTDLDIGLIFCHASD